MCTVEEHSQDRRDHQTAADQQEHAWDNTRLRQEQDDEREDDDPQRNDRFAGEQDGHDQTLFGPESAGCVVRHAGRRPNR